MRVCGYCGIEMNGAELVGYMGEFVVHKDRGDCTRLLLRRLAEAEKREAQYRDVLAKCAEEFDTLGHDAEAYPCCAGMRELIEETLKKGSEK